MMSIDARREFDSLSTTPSKMTPGPQGGFSPSATSDTIGFSLAYLPVYSSSPGNMSPSPYTNIQSSSSPSSYHPYSSGNYGITSPWYSLALPRYSSNDIYSSKSLHYSPMSPSYSPPTSSTYSGSRARQGSKSSFYSYSSPSYSLFYF